MDVSVILPTYNRCDLLPKALEKLLSQNATAEYEVIVVNNNSTDQTQEIIEFFVQRDNRCRYVFEKKQGLSHARNAGVAVARAETVVFTDDDVEVRHDWIQQIHEAVLRYPDADYLGGRVSPLGSDSLPAWAHLNLAPFGLQELGDEPFRVSKDRPRCLIGACLICRRRAFDKAGLFNPETQRVKDGVGSTEDADWESKVWEYGGHGMYVPQIVCFTPLSESRLQKAYHRKWHAGHGKFNAKARRDEWSGKSRNLLDIPTYMYRQLIEAALKGAIASAKGKRAEAFEHECNFLFCVGFIRERWSSARKKHEATNSVS